MKLILRNITLLLILSIFSLSHLRAQEGFVIYDKNGNRASITHILEQAVNKSHIFFGEYHNNPISHWFRQVVIQELHKNYPEQLVIGAEMFESDNQLLIDEYFSGIIRQNNFETEARLWPNYKTDYKSMVEFAKINSIPLIGTNIPRRYANIVYYGGMEVLDKLSNDAKTYIAPLPVVVDTTLSTYRDIKKMAGGHGGDNLVYSQAIKDATMAHFIFKNSKENTKFFHVNGSYHSDQYQGIISFLQNKIPLNKILTITTVSQKDITQLEEKNKKLADFIICVDENMTATH